MVQQFPASSHIEARVGKGKLAAIALDPVRDGIGAQHSGREVARNYMNRIGVVAAGKTVARAHIEKGGGIVERPFGEQGGNPLAGK